MRQSQRILAVINDRALYQKVAQLLDRACFEVNRVPSGAGALILVGNLRYDLIVVEEPLPDLDLRDFLAAVRTLDSPCAASSVAVVARTQEAADLCKHLAEDGVNVANASADPKALQRALSQALGVAARTSARLLVELKAKLDDGALQRMAQTANLSESGMLLSGAPLIPIGSHVELSFELPNDSSQIKVEAEVVRHTAPAERVTGIGVRFTQIATDAGRRLKEFLEVQLAEEATAPEGAENDKSDEELDTAAPKGA